MDTIALKAGDIFCSSFPGATIAPPIQIIQSIWDVDGKAEYSHSGIILDPEGTTFEALWKVKRRNIYRDFRKAKLLIGRHVKMTPETFQNCFQMVSDHEGQLYPVHRLFLHLIPPLARMFATGKFLVCSELVFKFLCGLGPGECSINYYKGVNPNYVADAIKRWDEFEIVYEQQED